MSFVSALNFKIAEHVREEADAANENQPQDDVGLEGMTFLCAEDNELNAEILTELLHMEGADCKICKNGALVVKAFEQAAPGEYDMILMDAQMPVMNGYQATDAIRNGSNPLGRKHRREHDTGTREEYLSGMKKQVVSITKLAREEVESIRRTIKH